jgi:anti-anti-sigma factor
VRNGVARLVIAGEIDMSVTQSLQRHLDRVATDGVVAALLDLREVRFMDCAGLHFLMRATQTAERSGRRLAVVGLGGMPKRLLEITGTQGVLVDEKQGIELMLRFTQPEFAASDGAMSGRHA